MITIDIVDKAWSNFEKYKETAEQHEFIKLIIADAKTKPLYDDLHANWNVHHAFVFLEWMQKLAVHFGFECPDFSEGEN